MQVIIDKYFEEETLFTMAGLAYALGMDRRSLLNYSNKDEFFPSIKKAKDRVEVFVEKRLYEGNVAGPIFNLKNNFDWHDKTERVISGSLGLHDLSEDELQRKIKELENKRDQSLAD